jgi:DNA-binding beta-propeller fold protein YncE
LLICDSQAGAIADVHFGTQTFRYIPETARLLKHPVGIHIDSRGHVFVSDFELGQVLEFDPGFTYQRAFGAPGSIAPVAAIPRGGFLYVLDHRDGEIEVFDLKSTKRVRTIGSRGGKPDQLETPSAMTWSRKSGAFYISDTGNFRVQSVTENGNWIRSFGRQGDRTGELARPKGITADARGRIFVADATRETVQVFGAQGAPSQTIGYAGLGQGGLVLPAGITRSEPPPAFFNHLVPKGYLLKEVVWVTNQFGPVKITAFGRFEAASR